jgi:hypothetical protein
MFRAPTEPDIDDVLLRTKDEEGCDGYCTTVSSIEWG